MEKKRSSFLQQTINLLIPLKKGKSSIYILYVCPGGYVVNASSEKGHIAINGMSEYKRDGVNANSALLVQVFPQDFEVMNL